MLAKDGYRCVECGSTEKLTVDHIEPLARNGKPYDVNNGRVLCDKCRVKDMLNSLACGRLPKGGRVREQPSRQLDGLGQS